MTLQLMTLQFELAKCIGCHLCELACTGCNEDLFAPSLARLRVNFQYKGDELEVVAKHCTLCQQCVEICPVEAITFENGRLHYNAEKCTSCYLCVEECPEEIIVKKEEGVGICQLCEGDPQCVAWCPHGALTWKEVQ